MFVLLPNRTYALHHQMWRFLVWTKQNYMLNQISSAVWLYLFLYRAVYEDDSDKKVCMFYCHQRTYTLSSSHVWTCIASCVDISSSHIRLENFELHFDSFLSFWSYSFVFVLYLRTHHHSILMKRGVASPWLIYSPSKTWTKTIAIIWSSFGEYVWRSKKTPDALVQSPLSCSYRSYLNKIFHYRSITDLANFAPVMHHFCMFVRKRLTSPRLFMVS